jgi:hypothetical protein
MAVAVSARRGRGNEINGCGREHEGEGDGDNCGSEYEGKDGGNDDDEGHGGESKEGATAVGTRQGVVATAKAVVVSMGQRAWAWA